MLAAIGHALTMSFAMFWEILDRPSFPVPSLMLVRSRFWFQPVRG